CFQDVQIPPTF
nr:immunoglobulin light chain junction region [Macaca mulatta]MOW61667.1 immunoglobulin light chain junction region [Macaca mulatta]MOW61737.1 immunoglobulin light chain junction region [Macaca mulatta]MOW61751.1 immunoglobulin light chain junction region [Macaca mulatta]MOW61786.1 immunoglobulin light chain junction region [Macaca mulatta]